MEHSEVSIRKKNKNKLVRGRRMENLKINEEDDPLVSIIIPIYKVEKYLSKCIDSVISQTYKNIEILLIDDGSPDNCPEICDLYAQKDKRIKVFHKENGGHSSARNLGLSVANGWWICFVDSDDYICDDYVEHFVNVALRTGAEIVCAGYEEIEEDTNESLDSNSISTDVSILEQEDALYLLLCDKLRSYPWNKMFYRGLWQDVRWREDYKVYEDCLTLYLVFAKSKKVAISNKATYRYLQRSSSILHEQNPDIFLKLFDVLDEQQKYIEKSNLILKKEIPFDLLRVEYYRRYVNYCISTNKNITKHLSDFVKNTHLSLIFSLFHYPEVLDRKSIFSNVVLLISEHIYIIWRKTR